MKIPADYRVLKPRSSRPDLSTPTPPSGSPVCSTSPSDQDVLEKSAPMQPELRAIDAYNAKDPLVAWVRSFGVTTVNTGHAPGALLSARR